MIKLEERSKNIILQTTAIEDIEFRTLKLEQKTQNNSFISPYREAIKPYSHVLLKLHIIRFRIWVLILNMC